MPNLNHYYVLQPFHNLIESCRNSVLLGLRLVEKAEAFPGPTPEERQFFQFFEASEADLVQGKLNFKRWILLHGLRDIHQCIGKMLQRFIIFKTIQAEIRHDPSFDIDIEAREAELRLELTKLRYPDLIKRADLFCSEPLILQKEVRSFNAARNCLEHAGGVVTARFCNSPGKDKLIVLGRRFKLFFKRGEDEKLAQFGRPGPENAALMLGAEDFAIEFAVGDPIELSLGHFLDILNTCFFLRADIDEKLAP
jgi:hypothetical protein